MKKTKIMPVFLLSVITLAGCTPKYVPPTYTDEDYGYLMDLMDLGELMGTAGELVFTKDYTTITQGELVTKLYPTDIQRETISYEATRYDEQFEEIAVTITEEILTVYYGTQRNDADYRITFTPTELKRLVLQKKVDGKYVDQSYFTPSAPQYSGAYNGYSEFDLGPSNMVYVIGDQLTKANDSYLGYDVEVYSAGYGVLQNSTNKLVTGFYLLDKDNDTYITVADFLDVSDGEFYDFILDANRDGNLYEIIGDIYYKSYYADPTMYLDTIVNEAGEVIKNSYEVEYDWDTFEAIGITATIDGKEATYSKRRTNSGLKYTFTFEDNTSIEVTSKLNGYEYTLPDGTVHKYAPTATSFKASYAGRTIVSGDFSKEFHAEIKYDEQTWEPVEEYKYNDQAIDNIKLIATGDGRATYSFVADGKDIKIKKLSTTLGLYIVDGEQEYAFDKDTFDTTFNVDLSNPPANISLEINDFKVSENGATAVQGKLVYDEELDTVMLNYGSKSVVGLSPTTGIYGLVSGTSLTLLFNNKLFKALAGTYTSDGTKTIKYEDGKFYVDGQEVQYQLSYVASSSDVNPAFEVGNNIYVPDLKGTISVYSRNASGALHLEAIYLSKTVFDSFIGTYSLLNNEGVIEHIQFTNDGKLYMDTENASGQLEPVQYNYSFSYDSSNKNFVINAIVNQGTVTVNVPFNKVDYALVLNMPNNPLFYIDDRLFELRGAYGDGVINTLFITENLIYFNNVKQTIKSIEKVDNVTTIKTATDTIVATFGVDGSISLTSTSNSGNVVNYTDRDAKLANYKGVEFIQDENTKFTLESYFASGAISIRSKKNGAMFGAFFFAAYYEGHLAIKSQTPFGTEYCFFDGSDNPIAKAA